MSHLKYYRFQATARGVGGLADVERVMLMNAHIYDRILLPWLPQDRSATITELACGHGSLLLWLKRRGFQNVRGIDSSAEQIHIARQTGCEIIDADVAAWLRDQPEESVASFVAIDLVEHLSKDTFVELLEQTRRALVPGGRLILRLPNGDSPLVGLNLFNDITHVWTYTSNCLNSLSQMAGFSQSAFTDESVQAIRDHRWIKVPMAGMARGILNLLCRAAARQSVPSWSPHLWACLTK